MITWAPRAEPLPIGGCTARGPAARALVDRLLALDDRALAALEGCATPERVVVFGPAAALPWVDGAVWLGQDPAAPSLWLPTHSAPGVPADLLARAVGRRVAGPVVVLPDVLVAAAALPLGRSHLAAWRASSR